MSADDCVEIFLSVLKGSSDIKKKLLEELISNYSAGDDIDFVLLSKEKLEEITQEIRDMRDADFHVCPYDQHQKFEDSNARHERQYYEMHPEHAEDQCTCKYFDQLIDKLEGE
jgi:hypothetical protein|tara:strand:+ start:5478 stop:5816 length:339 start_codon:yes stop_codon:yes gene_type:complete